MTSLTTRTGRAPSGWLLLTTAVTFATVLTIGVWLLREGSTSTRPEAAAVAEHPAGIPQEAITGAEKGGLAEVEDDLGRAQPAAPAPYYIYLVATADDVPVARELAGGEAAILVAGTPDELTAAQAQTALAAMKDAVAPDPREVRVVDLRQSSATHATDWSAQAGSAEEWAAWLQEQAWHDSFAATPDAARGDAVSEIGTGSAASEYVFLVDSWEQAEMLRTLGEPGRTRLVLVVEPADEHRLLQGLGAGDALRDSAGLPSITVIDLRARITGTTSTCGVDMRALAC
jgi:hypothetical protein